MTQILFVYYYITISSWFFEDVAIYPYKPFFSFLSRYQCNAEYSLEFWKGFGTSISGWSAKFWRVWIWYPFLLDDSVLTEFIGSYNTLFSTNKVTWFHFNALCFCEEWYAVIYIIWEVMLNIWLVSKNQFVCNCKLQYVVDLI